MCPLGSDHPQGWDLDKLMLGVAPAGFLISVFNLSVFCPELPVVCCPVDTSGLKCRQPSRIMSIGYFNVVGFLAA